MGSQNKTKRKEMLKSYKRQKGLCHICGGPMSLSNDITDPKRATADHVIPKSFFGGIKGNIKAAHAYCNVRRGNKSIEDARQYLKI